MLEEEIELQGIDKCKMVERGIDGEKCVVRSPEMSVRIAYEQEECIEEKICDRFLPEIYRAEESVYKDEIKLEIPIEQSESKAVQDVNTSVHAEHDILLPNETIDLCRTPAFEVLVASRKILSKIAKLHTRQRKALGSKLVRE